MPDPEADLEDALGRLTLEEKVALTAGVDLWHLPAVPHVGLAALTMSDGPVGVRGRHAAGGPPSACFPCGTALAATWDVALVERVGRELGAEARAKAAHLLLAPTVNIHRHPLAGRSFECYSEDPVLTARTAVAYVTGVQSQGVGACIKHFVANDSEFERFTISSEVPERALREIYLRPFEVALREAHPWAVMSAYNRLSGTWCSENRWLLTTVLREEWGYDGLVVSDWYGTHSTAEALAAGLDVEMPGPTQHRGGALLDALTTGTVEECQLDEAVRRILLLARRTGALADRHDPPEERADDVPDRRAVAREAAAAAIVLLRNEPVQGTPVLPLDGRRLRRIAVVGPNADAHNILGGGSASVSPYYALSVLEGLRERFPDADVRHEPGCGITRYPPAVDLRWTSARSGEPGIDVDYFAGEKPAGEPVAHQVTRRGHIGWSGRNPGDVEGPWSAVLSTRLEVPAGGRYLLQAGSTARLRLLLGDEVLVEDWTLAERHRRHEIEVDLQAGRSYDLRCELGSPPEGSTGAARVGVELRMQAPLPDDAFDRAVQLARECDVVVLVVGTNGDWETEGRDRHTLDLPGDQAALVEAVAAANPRTAVVVNAGAPVAMDWADRVPAVLQSWFLGQETGNAVADVLAGDVDASGRLPTTIPRRLEDTPAYTSYPGESGRVDYGEGLFVGYRWYDARGIPPRYPFGHGLSYTTFAYGSARVESVAHGGATVAVDVTNSGARRGATVVQAYVAPRESSVARPPKELRAYAKVWLEPGTGETVLFELDREAFAYWSPADHAWRADPGPYDVLLATSAANVVATVEVPLP